MSTAVDIDVAALVGGMDAVPCESLGHRYQTEVHGGPATAYARANCPCCGWAVVKAYCEPFTQFIAEGGLIRCSECAGAYPALGNVAILGPVAK